MVCVSRVYSITWFNCFETQRKPKTPGRNVHLHSVESVEASSQEQSHDMSVSDSPASVSLAESYEQSLSVSTRPSS